MIQFYGQIHKAVPSYSAASIDLRSFLSKEQPQLVRMLVRTWNNQQAAITYAELRRAILNGSITGELLEEWRQDYAKMVGEELLPIWQQAMQASAQQLLDHYPDYLYNPNATSIKAWTQQRAAELVVDITDSQRTAINGLLQRAAQLQDQSVDHLATVIRPLVGLYPGQVSANMNYYQAVRKNLLEVNPKMRTATAEKRALQASVRYAEKQHRYRAMMIARTELVTAYNHGELGAVKQAVADGFMHSVKKRWVSADDERVCKRCKGLEGTTVDIDALFPGGYDAPTAHPHCRCVLVYQEGE